MRRRAQQDIWYFFTMNPFSILNLVLLSRLP